MKKICTIFILLIWAIGGLSQEYHPLILKQSKKALKDLREFVSIPNDALNHDDIIKNIEWLEKAFSKRGFKTRRLETDNEPLFFAELPGLPDAPTLLFYMHLDGQGVDPSKWNQDSPYKLVLKKPTDTQTWEETAWDQIKDLPMDWRVFGRAAADDKGPIIMFLNAIDLMIQEDIGIRWNVKVLLDSEEEKGSAPLAKAVKVHRNILKADYLLIHDGPMHLSQKPTLVYGCRGITRVDLTVYGPTKPQHSGHYGNYAPNPVFRMAQLLASMKDENGRVLVKGYYDGIKWDEETRMVLASVPDDSPTIFEKLGIAEAEKVGNNYQESLQYPSLNVRGMQAAWVGKQARTIVPDRASVAMDLRLVPESDPDRLKQLLKEHITEQGYFLTDKEPSPAERAMHPKICKFETAGATLPFRTDLKNPFGVWMGKVLEELYGEAPVQIRIMGGTVPISPFINELKIPAIILPMVNADNNQHSPNENLRISQIPYGIKTFVGILERSYP